MSRTLRIISILRGLKRSNDKEVKKRYVYYKAVSNRVIMFQAQHGYLKIPQLKKTNFKNRVSISRRQVKRNKF